jgi:hypothetical protein
VLDKGAQAGGIKSGAALRKHLSVTVLQSTSTKTTGGAPNVQITVRGPWSRQAAVAAVTSLGKSLIAWANRYQQSKVDLLTAQITTDRTTLASLQSVLQQAQTQLKRSGGDATATATLLATISDTGERIDTITYQMTQNQIFLASAKDVESAGFVQAPSGGKVSASNRKSSLLIAVFAGLIVGVILALLWDAVRRRPRRGAVAT